jgi:hypothetical protein
VSTDEEKAALLRVIASVGYSPWDDQDGSTANTLYEMAEVLAPMAPPPPVHKKRGFLYRYARRVYLRYKLRRKMRRLGMIPVVLVAGTLVPKMGTAQARPDSLYTMPWVKDVIGDWRPQWGAWCLTRHADFGSLLVLVSVQLPDSATQCARPEGGSYPILINLPECPRNALVPTSAPFMLARCDDTGWVRFPARKAATPSTI